MLPEAGVVFNTGTILAVGPTKQLRIDYPDARIHDVGNAILLPGLVNPHTHLELSNMNPGDPPTRFVDWIIGLMRQSSSTRKSVPEAVSDAMHAGIAQCVRFGVTSVGDITSQPQLSRAVLAASPLAGVSYGEVRAMATRRGFLEERIAAAVHSIGGTSRLRAGITPHAPYSIETTGYHRCLEVARSGRVPLATHLAETPEEALFLAAHDGPFRELWTLLSAWDNDVPKAAGGPVRVAKTIGLLDYPTLLAHVNYADDEELSILSTGQASVVYCPRTHAYFGHAPHPWREMLTRGINVAVGTDSCASSPDLNLVDDLRLLHALAPDVDPHVLWELGTVRAARAIQCPEVGSLSPGMYADLTVFPVTSNAPLTELLEHSVLPSEVWSGGLQLMPWQP